MRTEYPEKYLTLGLKIAYYRKKAGYTQGTGMTRGVSLETLFKMADVLGIPPGKLLEDD